MQPVNLKMDSANMYPLFKRGLRCRFLGTVLASCTLSSRYITTLTVKWSEDDSSGYDEIKCTAFEAEVLTCSAVSDAIWAAVSTIPCTRSARWLAE
jgi:hypothetical protein